MDLTRCNQCGANLTPDDMTQPACRYCGTVLPHHAHAAQKAAIVTNLLADRNQNGIPDAFEGLVAGNLPPGSHVVGGAGRPVVVSTHVVAGPGAVHVAHAQVQRLLLQPPAATRSAVGGWIAFAIVAIVVVAALLVIAGIVAAGLVF